MTKWGPIKKGVRVRSQGDKRGRINSVFLSEDGEVGINVVWDDRQSGTYQPQEIALDDWSSNESD